MRCTAAVILVVVFGLVGLAGCNDVRDFAGSWRGERVRGTPVPQDTDAGGDAVLTIDAIDKHGLRGSLLVRSAYADGSPTVDTTFSSLEAAEADVLATTTFAGDPLRVYLALVPVTRAIDVGDALLVISLYDAHRIELRLIKGEPYPLYSIFTLTER